MSNNPLQQLQEELMQVLQQQNRTTNEHTQSYQPDDKYTPRTRPRPTPHFDQVKNELYDFYNKTAILTLYKNYKSDWDTQSWIPKKLKQGTKTQINQASYYQLQPIITNYYQHYIKTHINQLPPLAKHIISQVVWHPNFQLNINQLDPIQINTLFRNPHNVQNNFTSLKPPYQFFRFQNETDYWSYRSNKALKGYLYLPESLCLYLRSQLPKPPHYRLKPTKLKQDATTIDNSQDIANKWQLYTDYLNTIPIDFKKDGYPTKASLKKMTDQCHITTPIPLVSQHNPYLKTELLIGTQLLINEIIKAEYPDQLSKDPITQLQFFFSHILPTKPAPAFYTPLLMPHFSLRDTDLERSISPNLFTQLKKISTQWHQLDHWIQHLSVTDVDINLYADYYYYTLKTKKIEKSHHRLLPQVYSINDKNYHILVTTPFIRSWIYWLNTLGITEISTSKTANTTYSLPNHPYLSPGDYISSFRLTPWGQYLLGITKTNPIQTQTTESELILHPRQPIITLKGNNPVIHIFLNQITQSLGQNRYHLTPKSFYSKCKTQQEAAQRIQQLKQHLPQHSNLSPFWQNLITQLAKYQNPLTPVSDHLIFKLKQDQDLYHLFITDEYLRKNTIRAQNHHIIINNDNINLVINYLSELGYYIDYQYNHSSNKLK